MHGALRALHPLGLAKFASALCTRVLGFCNERQATCCSVYDKKRRPYTFVTHAVAQARTYKVDIQGRARTYMVEHKHVHTYMPWFLIASYNLCVHVCMCACEPASLMFSYIQMRVVPMDHDTIHAKFFGGASDAVQNASTPLQLSRPLRCSIHGAAPISRRFK